MQDWNAEEYSRRSTLQKAMADQVLALLHLSGSERVLDVGCGDGKVTAIIAGRLPEGSVVGVDATPGMIAFASEHFDRTTYPNLSFQVADARSLPFREMFDLAVSFNALHWVTDQDAALRSIHRALKPRAKTQLRLVPDGARKSIENVLEETRRAPRWARYFDGFTNPYLHLTPEQYGETAERNGFRVESLSLRDETWNFGSASAFQAFGLANFVKWTQQLPESERAAFAEDVLARYETVAGQANTFKFYQLDVGLMREG